MSECIVTESSAPAALPRQSAQIGRPDRPGSASFAPPASGDHLPGTTTVPYSSTSPSAATDRIGRPACVLARPLAPSFPMKTWLNAIFFCRCGTITVSAPPGIPPLHSFLLVIDIAGARHPGWIRSGGISAIRALPQELQRPQGASWWTLLGVLLLDLSLRYSKFIWMFFRELSKTTVG